MKEEDEGGVTKLYCKPRNISELLKNLAIDIIKSSLSGRSKVMQARGQIALLAIVATVISIIRWLKNKESSPLLPVGDAPTSAANKEVEKADVQHRQKRGIYHHYVINFDLKWPSTKSLKFIFAKISIILETLNILAANISRFTVVSELHHPTIKRKPTILSDVWSKVRLRQA